MNTIEIPLETYDRLIAAESKLNSLQRLLGIRRNGYCGLRHEEVDAICRMYAIEDAEEAE